MPACRGGRQAGRALTLSQVRRLGKYATHRCSCGSVFEFDDGGFWVTRPDAHGPGRVAIQECGCLPRRRWYHHTLCDCEVCRPH